MLLEQTRARRGKTTTVMAIRPRNAVANTDGADALGVLNHLSRSESPPAGWRFRKGPILLSAALAGLLALGVVPRLTSQAETVADSTQMARRVHVTGPEWAAVGEVTLPATLLAHQWTDLYARVNGYVKGWKADIGTKVKAGELLAEIDTPELDQELQQAEAQLKQGEAELEQARAEQEEAQADVKLAEANLNRARANLEFAGSQQTRYRQLTGSGAASREEYESIVRDRDARKAEVDAAQADLNRRKTNLATRAAIIGSRAATVNSRRANVQRLQELQGFKQIVAPFDGVVARRHAEVGTLVSAGSGPNVRPLFSVGQPDVLRVQVPVPQTYAVGVREGDQAQVTIPEYPDRTFPARVARTANAVEPSSRTLLVELELPNTDGALLIGAYAQVKLQAKRTDAGLLVPAHTLVMRTDGPHVAAVSGDRVRLQKVRLGRDYGAKVEVVAGLSGGEALVVNPSDDLRDDQRVEVAGRGEAADGRLVAQQGGK